jgi:hypothetical protein
LRAAGCRVESAAVPRSDEAASAPFRLTLMTLWG